MGPDEVIAVRLTEVRDLAMAMHTGEWPQLDPQVKRLAFRLAEKMLDWRDERHPQMKDFWKRYNSKG